MKPRTVVHNLPRHEIGASQMLSPKKRYCSARVSYWHEQLPVNLRPVTCDP
jgi:hypothetical protein